MNVIDANTRLCNLRKAEVCISTLLNIVELNVTLQQLIGTIGYQEFLLPVSMSTFGCGRDGDLLLSFELAKSSFGFKRRN